MAMFLLDENALTGIQWKLLLAVPLIPLVGYVIQIFFGRHLPRKGDWLLTGGMFVVMCITVYLFFTRALAFEPTAANPALFHESMGGDGPSSIACDPTTHRPMDRSLHPES